MVKSALEEAIRTLDLRKEIDIAAPIAVTFDAILSDLGPESVMPDGTPFPMKIEPWPGGRWFRDLGDNAGHLWGHVQVIKPPKLLEISGPFFMSYPAVNFVQYRLTENGGSTVLALTHQAMGMIPDDVFEGVGSGWEHGLNRIREIAESRG